jgi:hypothetical protein
MTTATASPTRARSRGFGTALLLIILAFVATRLWILDQKNIPQTSTGLFMLAGFEYRAAMTQGESVYAIHARNAAQMAQALEQEGGPSPDPARGEMEYPPLCVAWLALPTLFAPPGSLDHPSAAQINAADTAFRCMIAIADAITFALIFALLRRGFGQDRSDWPWRLGVYVLGGLILFNVLYDRFDLVVAMLVMLALWLLISRAHWIFGMLVLAVAVNFKLVPIMLLPAFAIGATPIRSATSNREFLGRIAVRAIVLIGWCGLIFLPFFLRDGSASLGFLHYHAERGLQIESLPATLALLASQGVFLIYTHGATEVAGGSTRAIVLYSTMLALIAVCGVTVWMLMWARRAGAQSEAPDATTFAQKYPRKVILFSLLLLWSAMASGKVFSPQYLLWLLPLVALIPLPRRRGIAFDIAFLILCGLTTTIFPYLYKSDIVRPLIAPPRYELLLPTTRGLALLIARNGLFVTMLVWVGWITLLTRTHSVEAHAHPAEAGRADESRRADGSRCTD